MFYYNYQNKTFCIDVTTDDSRYGWLVNHSKKLPNIKMKMFVIDSKPLLFLVATTNILVGQEILYDYGDRSKRSLVSYPWLTE